MEDKIVCVCTHADDNPERASMPFVMSVAALAMDTQATIVLQGQGVYLARKGYVDNMLPGGGFPPLKKLLGDFLELGGKLAVCGPCIKSRNIPETELVEGASVTAAAQVLEETASAQTVLTY
jgi:uncharacterized protein involved in oxidation of intracellular sulfur